MVLATLIRQLDLYEAVLVIIIVRQVLLCVQQVHLLLRAVVHIARYQLLDVLDNAQRLHVEYLLKHVEKVHICAVHQQQNLFLDVLGLPHVQFFEVEGVFGRVFADLVLLQKQRLVIILMVLVILIVSQSAIQLLEYQVERGLLAHKGLRFRQV